SVSSWRRDSEVCRCTPIVYCRPLSTRRRTNSPFPPRHYCSLSNLCWTFVARFLRKRAAFRRCLNRGQPIKEATCVQTFSSSCDLGGVGHRVLCLTPSRRRHDLAGFGLPRDHRPDILCGTR